MKKGQYCKVFNYREANPFYTKYIQSKSFPSNTNHEHQRITMNIRETNEKQINTQGDAKGGTSMGQKYGIFIIKRNYKSVLKKTEVYCLYFKKITNKSIS